MREGGWMNPTQNVRAGFYNRQDSENFNLSGADIRHITQCSTLSPELPLL